MKLSHTSGTLARLRWPGESSAFALLLPSAASSLIEGVITEMQKKNMYSKQSHYNRYFEDLEFEDF